MEIILAVLLTSTLFVLLMLFQRKQFIKRLANHANIVSELEKLNMKASELKGQLTELTSKLNVASAELKSAEEATNALNTKQIELLKQTSETESNLVRSKSNFHEFNQKLAVLMHEYKTTTSSHQTLSAQFEKLIQDISAAKTNLQAVNDRTIHLL